MPTTGHSPGRPMLATKGDHVPTGPDWRHEIKWDGIRALVDVRPGYDGAARVWTRSERDVTVAFPELRALGRLGGTTHDLLLDGEIVRLGDGTPSLHGLADRIHLTDGRKAERLAAVTPVTLLVFDVLRYDGRDLTGLSWTDRRVVLEGLGLDDVSWQVPGVFEDGEVLRAATEQQGLEGVVSKRTNSRYTQGARSREWLKFPNRPTSSFVVGGWRHETDSPGRIGAVLVGAPTPGGLAYRGRVGSGLAGKAGRALQAELAPLARDDSPFAAVPGLEVPRIDAAGATWVEPRIVVDVTYLLLSEAGRLRQPAYQGMRADLTPADLGPAEGNGSADA